MTLDESTVNSVPPTDSVDPALLLAEGWTRQNVASGPRLSEALELYENLGLETLLIPVLQECAAHGEGGACTACFAADENPDRYKVIYTRPKRKSEGEPNGAIDGLFDP